MHIDLPSKKLFFFFIPIIIGLIIFVTFREKINQSILSKNQSPAISVVNLKDTNSWNPSKDDLAIIKKLKDGSPLQASTTSSGEKISVTGLVAMKLFADNVSLQENGLNSVSNLKDLALNTTNNVFANKAKNVYMEKDLNIIPLNSGVNSLLTFANDFLLASRQVEIQLSNVIDSNAETMDPSSPNFKTTMLAVSKAYMPFVKKIVSIPVPKEISKSYILLVNNYARSIEEFKTVSVGSDDPIPTIVAISNIKNNDLEQDALAKVLGNYINARGVIYSESLGLYVLKTQ
jgi:hypothetical protein